MKTNIKYLPSYIESPSAWIGENIAKRKNDWSSKLQTIEIKELVQAAHTFIACGFQYSGDRPLPACFKQRFDSIKTGDSSGIITQDTKLNVPLD